MDDKYYIYFIILVLITTSCVILISGLGYVWYKHQQKKKQKQLDYSENEYDLEGTNMDDKLVTNPTD